MALASNSAPCTHRSSELNCSREAVGGSPSRRMRIPSSVRCIPNAYGHVWTACGEVDWNPFVSLRRGGNLNRADYIPNKVATHNKVLGATRRTTVVVGDTVLHHS